MAKQYNLGTLLNRVCDYANSRVNVAVTQNYTTVAKYGNYTSQQTATDLWTPGTGKKFVLTDISVSTATAGTITLLDEAAIIREYKLAANGGAVENLKSVIMSAAANQDLKVTTSGALDCFIVVSGYEV